MLAGPLTALPRFGTDACEYHVAEIWDASELKAAWIGDLDGDGRTDAVTAREEGEVMISLGKER